MTIEPFWAQVSEPIYSLSEFEAVNSAFAQGALERGPERPSRGPAPAASLTALDDNRQALVVDFREIYSLSYDYLTNHASRLGSRWRLKFPFLEHFSQAFAQFSCAWDSYPRFRSSDNPLVSATASRTNRWKTPRICETGTYYHGKKGHRKRVTTERPHPTG